MSFKAVLLVFLLFFASVATIALVSLSNVSAGVTSGLKTATLALRHGIVQPAGGDPIDDPHPS